MTQEAASPVWAPHVSAGQVEIRRLTVRRGGRGQAQTVVEGLDLTVEPGELVSLVGPSGCGKSSLLSVIAGFLAPTSGLVRVDGEPIEAPSPNVGMVFQQSSLLAWRTVEENIAFGLKMRGVARRARHAAARELIAAVGLGGFEGHYPSQLSGGMRQRVEIARVLINRPRVILMDEPFASLDAQTRAVMQELLLDVWSRLRTTVLFVTHDIEEAIFLGDRVLMMTRAPARLLEDIAVPFGRPRGTDLTTSPSFVTLKRRCRDLVRQQTVVAPT